MYGVRKSPAAYGRLTPRILLVSLFARWLRVNWECAPGLAFLPAGGAESASPRGVNALPVQREPPNGGGQSRSRRNRQLKIGSWKHDQWTSSYLDALP